MAKLSRISLARKKELSRPDEFMTISNRILDFANEHKFPLIAAGSALLFILIGLVGYQYFHSRAETKGFSFLDKALFNYEKLVKAKGSDKAYPLVKDEFESILKDYSGTEAGKLARVYLANICYDAGIYPRAIDLYSKASSDFALYPPLKNVALCGLAYSYDAKGDQSKAKEFFTIVAQGSDLVMKDEALFNLGRIYYEAGNKEKGRKAFKEIVNNFSDSIYFELAKEKIESS